VPQAQVLAKRYELGDRIGGGGMADVYRAVDQRLDRPVAVKVFRPGTDVAGRRRFEAEARLVAGLAHAGLVPVYDVGLDDAAPFLVMQLVDGPNLAQQVATGPFPPGRTARIGVELARTLAYVHARSIVHRDVKPSNVLLDPTGRVLLTDFGVSRLVDATRLTATGQAIGTAAYLAPEQVRGATAGPAADVYALGLVLLECLTAAPAYRGSSPVEVAVARLHRPPEVPSRLPPALASTLAAMVSTDPASRPTAEACGRQLAPLADGAPVAPAAATAPTAVLDPSPTRQMPVPPEQPTAGPVAALRGVHRRHPRAVGIGGLVLAAVALIAIVSSLLANAGGGADPGTGGNKTSPPATATTNSRPPTTPGATTQTTVPPGHGRDHGHGHGDGNGNDGNGDGNGQGRGGNGQD
jgi:eukaryotic-like serine/threonine-protein kinase